MTDAFNEVIIRDQSYLFVMIWSLRIPAFLRGAVICYIDHFFWFLLYIILYGQSSGYLVRALFFQGGLLYFILRRSGLF